MRRTTALTATMLVALAAGLSPTTATGAATGAAETCRGETPTIVGAPAAEVVGTEGRDVVVTNGSFRVRTLGGDDLVCMTSPPNLADTAEVDTGAGNDLLDATAGTAVRAVLGSGADHYEGDDGVVAAGEAVGFLDDEGRPGPHVDTEADVLIGGSGSDELLTGQVGVPNADTVLGAGGEDTITYAGPQHPGGRVAGGPGTDVLDVVLPAGDTAADAAARTMTIPGGAVAWTEIERYSFAADDAAERRLTFHGTAGEDELAVGVEEGLTLLAHLGRGDDVLEVLAPPQAGALDGERGRDALLVLAESGAVELDMRDGVLEADAGAVTGSVVVRGFEAAAASAPRVRLAGTDGSDYLLAEACRTVVRGRGGDDVIDSHGGSDFFPASGPCRPRALLDGGRGADYVVSVGRSRDTIRGGPGHDRLDGQRGPDRITGGPGHDTVDGGPGPRADTCRAEREVRCER